MLNIFTPGPVRLPYLSRETGKQINHLLAELAKHNRRNAERIAYYRAKNVLSHLKRTPVVPDRYYNLGLVVGWCGKAVDLLARRCRLEKITFPDGDLDELGWNELAEDNGFTSEVQSAIVESLINGISFMAVAETSQADQQQGAPAAVAHTITASEGTGTWNATTRRLTDFLRVTKRQYNEPTGLVYYHATERGFRAEKLADGWHLTRTNPGVPVVPLIYKPRAGHPLGESRITPPMMSYQDAALRELIRLEGHMDVYSWPEFYILGPDRSVFTQTDWEIMIGRIKTIADNRNGVPGKERADVLHFPASDPTPHLATLNLYAKLFAREASLPNDSLAITDMANPTSDKSYEAGQYELVAEAEGATADWTPAIKRIAALLLAAANGTDPDDYRGLALSWRSPRYVSKVEQAEAGMKQIQAIPWLADTALGLELIGLTPEQVQAAISQRDEALADQQLTEFIAALLSSGEIELDERRPTSLPPIIRVPGVEDDVTE